MEENMIIDDVELGLTVSEIMDIIKYLNKLIDRKDSSADKEDVNRLIEKLKQISL